MFEPDLPGTVPDAVEEDEPDDPGQCREGGEQRDVGHRPPDVLQSELGRGHREQPEVMAITGELAQAQLLEHPFLERLLHLEVVSAHALARAGGRTTIDLVQRAASRCAARSIAVLPPP